MKKIEAEDKIGHWMTICEKYFAEKDSVLKARLYNHMYKAENTMSREELKTISSMNERGRIAAKRLLPLKASSSRKFLKNTSSGKITTIKQLEDLAATGENVPDVSLKNSDSEYPLSIPELMQGFTVVEELYFQLRELRMQMTHLIINNLKR